MTTLDNNEDLPDHIGDLMDALDIKRKKKRKLFGEDLTDEELDDIDDDEI
jgi:hypothetical protein